MRTFKTTLMLATIGIIGFGLDSAQAQRPEGASERAERGKREGQGRSPRDQRPMDHGAIPAPLGEKNVAWYTTWDTAMAEAKRTNKAIFYFAAAAQCSKVPGTF